MILYHGNSITIYYEVNTWNSTQIGMIQNLTHDELKAILGNEDVNVTFSLDINATVVIANGVSLSNLKLAR